VADIGQVDFYILAAQDASAGARYACRLAEKAYRLGHRVHLRAESSSAATALDDLLWTFRQGSFVPHEMSRPGRPPESPVTIGCAGETPPAADLLINLAGSIPEQAAEFARVAEIVEGSAESKALGRQRYQHYRASGAKLITHDIGDEP
jgi:DNA polymerase-3 subunit chi